MTPSAAFMQRILHPKLTLNAKQNTKFHTKKNPFKPNMPYKPQ